MSVLAAPLRASVTALGCKVNFAEMADLAGRLAAAGVEVVSEDEPADVRVLNSCTVTLQADATTRQRLSRLRRQDPQCQIVLTGCSVDGNPDRYLAAGEDGARRLVPGVDAVFSNAEKPGIAEHVLALAGARRGAPARPDAALRSRLFLKVQDGCDHRCTYCIVWRARGPAVSRPLDAVLREAEAGLAAGHREVVLTGVDLGSWGRDLGLRLSDLVAALLDRVGNGRLRLSSVNANDITPALAALAAHPRLCPHWHIPLQSGSDAVLRAMHRGYRAAQYRRVVESLRTADPRVEVSTDIMVAFPGENEDDHAATLRLVEDVGFVHCHVFRHSARPGTPSAIMVGAVADEVARRRSREMRREAARAAVRSRERAVGRVLEVVWERATAGEARGLAGTYHTVIAPPTPATVPGGLQHVLVESADGEVLRGRCTGAATAVTA